MTQKKIKRLCLIEGCTQYAVCRGLCHNCYQAALRLVKREKSTWEELVKKGWARSAQRKEGSAFARAYREAWNIGADGRPNPDPPMSRDKCEEIEKEAYDEGVPPAQSPALTVSMSVTEAVKKGLFPTSESMSGRLPQPKPGPLPGTLEESIALGRGDEWYARNREKARIEVGDVQAEDETKKPQYPDGYMSTKISSIASPDDVKVVASAPIPLVDQKPDTLSQPQAQGSDDEETEIKKDFQNVIKVYEKGVAKELAERAGLDIKDYRPEGNTMSFMEDKPPLPVSNLPPWQSEAPSTPHPEVVLSDEPSDPEPKPAKVPYTEEEKRAIIAEEDEVWRRGVDVPDED